MCQNKTHLRTAHGDGNFGVLKTRAGVYLFVRRGCEERATQSAESTCTPCVLRDKKGLREEIETLKSSKTGDTMPSAPQVELHALGIKMKHNLREFPTPVILDQARGG